MLELLSYLLVAAGGAALAGIVVRARTARRPADSLQSPNLELPKQNLAQLQRVARMFAALSDTNEAIMRVSSPEDLYQRVCEAAVHGGRLKAASICVPREASGDAKVVAVAGEDADSLRDVQISIDSSTAIGRG